MLVDSDVMIWLTRGHPGAAMRLKKIGTWRISAITYMELAQGCRDTPELHRLKKALGTSSKTIAPVTEKICERAMLVIDRHALGDGLRLADALIAATALEHDLPLLTANIKHFGPIKDLNVEWFDRSQEATS